MGTLNMRSKELLLQAKENIIRLKQLKQRDSINFKNGQVNNLVYC